MSKKKAARPSGQVHGVLLVDKPGGLTSFDVVAQVRKLFGTRKVGHAGTLDPMATGVLVILLGEATKLSNVLTTDKKSYRTTVSLGATTDTLDKDGRVTKQAPVPAPLEQASVLAALELERVRRDQLPPQVSAIKVAGQRAYQQARKGIEVELALRAVHVHELALEGFDEQSIDVSLTVSKGYYVRSFGRDLAERLGTLGHLSQLRRTQSGPFHESEAHPFPLCRELPLLSLEQAALRCLTVLDVSALGAQYIRQGKRLPASEVTNERNHLMLGERKAPQLFAAFFEDRLIALLEQLTPNEYRVQRGLAYQAPLSPQSADQVSVNGGPH